MSLSLGAVRLSGGFQQKSGLVEVLINGSWIPIAQENWTRENAKVVCRHLGYAEVASLLGADDLCPIPEKTEFVVGGVNCSGEETTISGCMWTVLDAKGLNKFPIGVTCAGKYHRLVNKYTFSAFIYTKIVIIMLLWLMLIKLFLEF